MAKPLWRRQYSIFSSPSQNAYDNSVQKQVMETSEMEFRHPALQVPPTMMSTLPNGLRVVSEPRRGETAAVGVFILAGSRQETQQNNGVAHFLEHMYFKGTPKRSGKDLEIEYENAGAFLNGHTSREYTAFTSHCLSSDLGRSVESLSDILLNSKIDNSFIEKERDTILREYQEVNQSIQEYLFDKLHERAYPNSSLGFTILGPEKNIQSLTREQMLNFRSQYYTASRMVLVGVGNIEHEQLAELGEKYFSRVPPTPENDNLAPPPADFLGGDFLHLNEDIPLFHCCVGFEGPGLTDPDILVLNLVQFLIGSYDRSMGAGRFVSAGLCRRIAEFGLARSVNGFSHPAQDRGLFGLHMVGDGGEDTVWLLQEAISGLVRLSYRLTEPQLARAKNLMKAQILSQSESSLDSVIEDVGRQYLFYKRRISTAEYIDRIERITIDDVQQFILKYVYDRDPVVCAVGNTLNYPDYTYVQAFTRKQLLH